MSLLARPVARVAMAVLLATPVVGRAQGADSPLTIHGYLTQGLGVTDGLPLNGLTRDATTDYRSMALVFRYEMDPKNQFVLQLRSRRFGASLINGAESDVALHWAYYQGFFGPLGVKVGKVPVPLGIYNETRAVGTLLPFYRAPSFLYPDGQETETGALVSYHSPEHRGWSGEISAHYGDEDFAQVVVFPTGPRLLRPILHHRVGGYAWLNTPIEGVRIGAGGVTLHLVDTAVALTFLINDVRYALDVTRERAYLRSELEYVKLGTFANARNYYVETGVTLIGGLSLNGLYQEANALGGLFAPPPGAVVTWVQTSDRALALDYAFTPARVAKIEVHSNRGFNYDTFIPTDGAPGSAKYLLVSLAVSF